MGQGEKSNIFKIVLLCIIVISVFLISFFINTAGSGIAEKKTKNYLAEEIDEPLQDTVGAGGFVKQMEPQTGAADGAVERKEENKVNKENPADPEETPREKPDTDPPAGSAAIMAAREEDDLKQEEAQEPESKQEVHNTEVTASQDASNNKELNAYVLDMIKTYEIGAGRYPYLLNNDYTNYNGVTATLTYQDQVLLKAHPSGNRASHCVGITFEVFFKAMQARNRELGIAADDFNGMTWDELYDFAMNWYAASGVKKSNNLVIAGEKYGIGRKIDHLADVRPGDFIDFSRDNNTGHTVVFLNWLKEGDNIVGLKYWSSQESTNGINYKEEYFSGGHAGKDSHVIKDSLLILRILPVSRYQAFR
ncbi:MAG: hypothetical protein ACOWWO_09510 [Peptococcaceae bacterium]